MGLIRSIALTYRGRLAELEQSPQPPGPEARAQHQGEEDATGWCEGVLVWASVGSGRLAAGWERGGGDVGRGESHGSPR
jgi:hypothetical protein